MARRLLAPALALAALTLLAGCARPVGDFGRAQPGVLHDELMPAIGKQLRSGSAFNLTDQEVEMRDRIWRYLVAPHAYDWFGDIAVEYQRTNIVPISSKPLKTDLYYDWLHGERFASSRVRYSRIAEDAIADTNMMPDAFRSICAVIEIDRQRAVARREISDLGADVAADVDKRNSENQAAIGWFVRSVAHRYASYDYALDHLLVETPHEEAVLTNARLNELAIFVERAERGDFCSGPDSVGEDDNRGTRSRYLRSAPSEGPYRK